MRLLIALVALVVCACAEYPERNKYGGRIRLPSTGKGGIRGGRIKVTPGGSRGGIKKNPFKQLKGFVDWLKDHLDQMDWEKYSHFLDEQGWTEEDAYNHFDQLPAWLFEKYESPLESRRAARAFENFENFEVLFGSQDWDDFRNWAKDLKGGWKEAWNAWLGSEENVKLWEKFLFENGFNEEELLNNADLKSSLAPAWMGMWFDFFEKNQQNFDFY